LWARRVSFFFSEEEERERRERGRRFIPLGPRLWLPPLQRKGTRRKGVFVKDRRKRGAAVSFPVKERKEKGQPIFHQKKKRTINSTRRTRPHQQVRITT
jgi:hypothetical protein